jgi:hypothetical protein
MCPATRARTIRRLPYLASVATLLASSAASGLLVGLAQPARAALVATGVPDNATVKHDRTLAVAAPGVLANDLNLLGSSTASLVSGVSYGTLTLRSSGGYTYVPAAGFVGTDSFRYKPSGLLSTPATVTITVTNALPVATPDAYTWPGGTLTVAPPGVLANDSDADGDALIAELVGGGISGSFDLDQNGGFRYTPGGGFSGTGTVTYRVWDGVAWSATTTIRLTRQAATPSPTPTPRPTPAPTPFVPLPSLPLPSLPLPSLPLPSLPLPVPVPSLGATPTPSRTPAPREALAQPSPSPEGMPAGNEVGSPGPSTAPRPIGPPTDGGLVATGRPSGGSQLFYDRDRLDLQAGGFGILAGFHIWAVPAASIAVPGLLVLLWVALQMGGALAWIPAVRRLRGEKGQAKPT